MTRHHARARRREHQAAELVGSERVVRPIGESAPDVVPTALPLGLRIQAEAKERAKPLATVERWLLQAESYAVPGTAPVLVVYATGRPRGEALVVMRAADWRRAVGLEELPEQGSLPLEVRRG